MSLGSCQKCPGVTGLRVSSHPLSLDHGRNIPCLQKCQQEPTMSVVFARRYYVHVAEILACRRPLSRSCPTFCRRLAAAVKAATISAGRGMLRSLNACIQLRTTSACRWTGPTLTALSNVCTDRSWCSRHSLHSRGRNRATGT